MAAKKVRMSAEGLKNLEKELEYLITERRVETLNTMKLKMNRVSSKLTSRSLNRLSQTLLSLTNPNLQMTK